MPAKTSMEDLVFEESSTPHRGGRTWVEASCLRPSGRPWTRRSVVRRYVGVEREGRRDDRAADRSGGGNGYGGLGGGYAARSGRLHDG